MELSTKLVIVMLKAETRMRIQFVKGLAVLWICIASTNSAPVSADTLQTGSPRLVLDDSDWWSFTGRPELDVYDEALSQKRELPSSNFRILGLELNEEIFEKARTKLGKVAVVQRGDGSAGRFQVCYSSVRSQPKTYLVFEKGEVNDALYLFNVGPDWKGSHLCGGSNLLTAHSSTTAGLHLGQTKTQVKTILGKPSSSGDDKMVYFLESEKKTSTADFESLKRRNPQIGEDELHRAYDSYSLTVYVEARFSSGKLVYLAISKTTTDIE
jgi:hypothetical protein